VSRRAENWGSLSKTAPLSFGHGQALGTYAVCAVGSKFMRKLYAMDGESLPNCMPFVRVEDRQSAVARSVPFLRTASSMVNLLSRYSCSKGGDSPAQPWKIGRKTSLLMASNPRYTCVHEVFDHCKSGVAEAWPPRYVSCTVSCAQTALRI